MAFKEYFNYSKPSTSTIIKRAYGMLDLALLVIAATLMGFFTPSNDDPIVVTQVLKPLPITLLLAFFILWGCYPLFDRWADRKFAE